MKNYYYKISALFLIFSSIACSQSLPNFPQPHPSGKVIYQTNEFGNFEIISIDPDSKKTVRLTNNSANDFSPTYISDTDQVGFISDRNNFWGLYTMNLSGENIKAVVNTKNIALDYPDWSSDGNFIAASLVEDCKYQQANCIYDIYTMNSEGNSFQKLTETAASEWVPDWSPDSRKIAFASDRDGDSEIYVMDKDGTNLEKLTDNRGYDGRPRWSPDGKTISFETDQDGGDWDIYIMNTDGSTPRPITSNGTNDFSQSWSPDGNWLVYVSNADGDNEIFIVDINGQNQLRLTTNDNNDIAPVWAP